jgi:hypothetical protein
LQRCFFLPLAFSNCPQAWRGAMKINTIILALRMRHKGFRGSRTPGL